MREEPHQPSLVEGWPGFLLLLGLWLLSQEQQRKVPRDTGQHLSDSEEFCGHMDLFQELFLTVDIWSQWE